MSLFHKRKNNNIHSSDNHDRAQHERLPTGPAPGGSSTPIRRGVVQRFREKFQKPPERPATMDEVKQLRLDSQRAQYRYAKQYAETRSKQLKKSNPSGVMRLISSPSPPASRGGRTRVIRESSSIFSDNSSFENEMIGGEGAMNMFGAGSKPKGRGKQQDDWGGLKDMF